MKRYWAERKKGRLGSSNGSPQTSSQRLPDPNGVTFDIEDVAKRAISPVI
jgi:hypothetical protein